MTHTLPSTSDDLTPELLNPLLSDAPQFAGAEIVGCDVEIIGTGRGFAGEVALISLEFADKASSAPSAIVAKMPSAYEATRRQGFAGETYEHEHLFFTHFGAKSGAPVPDCYFSGFDREEEKAILLLEDLSDYFNPDTMEEISLEEATLAVDAHASMHARWWADERLKEFAWLNSAGRRANIKQGFLRGLEIIPELGTEGWPEGVLDVLIQMDQNWDRTWAKYDEEPRTLVQVDARKGNLMISRAPDQERHVKVIDFGGVAIGKGAWDIAYFNTGAFDPATRRTYEPELMRAYFDGLATGGVTNYTWDEFVEDYRWGMAIYPAIRLIGLGATDRPTMDDAANVTAANAKMIALIDWDCGSLLN